MPYATGISRLFDIAVLTGNQYRSNNHVKVKEMKLKAFTTAASQSVQGTLNLAYLPQKR
jgi:hypothetical protein